MYNKIIYFFILFFLSGMFLQGCSQTPKTATILSEDGPDYTISFKESYKKWICDKADFSANEDIVNSEEYCKYSGNETEHIKEYNSKGESAYSVLFKCETQEPPKELNAGDEVRIKFNAECTQRSDNRDIVQSMRGRLEIPSWLIYEYDNSYNVVYAGCVSEETDFFEESFDVVEFTVPQSNVQEFTIVFITDAGTTTWHYSAVK